MLWIRMCSIQPLQHIPPSRRHNTFDIQLLPGCEAVAAVIADSRNGDTTGLGGEEIRTAASEDK